MPTSGSPVVGKTIAYNAIGNITSKSDVGTYAYPAAGAARPHAVTATSGGALTTSFGYDGNGNMTSGAGRSLAYTSFNMVSSVTQGGKTLTFGYDPEHDRVLQNAPEGWTVYLPRVEASNTAMHLYVQDTAGHDVADLYRTGIVGGSSGSLAIKYLVNDWQNSVSVVTDASGNYLEGDSYDAWGKRRQLNGADDTNGSITSQTVHGYTNQEHLQDVALIDLNARMYDPQLGKMLAVDPAVPDWKDTQAWNAYAYARDNPLHYTDPSGMSFTADVLQWLGLITEPTNPVLTAPVQQSDQKFGELECKALATPEPQWTTRAKLLTGTAIQAAGTGAIAAADVFSEGANAPLVGPEELGVKATAAAAVGAMSSGAIAAEETGVSAEALDALRNGDRVGSALKSDPYHIAPTWVDPADVAANGQQSSIIGHDGMTRTLVQLQGEMNNTAGRFEWIIQNDGSISHQLFVPNGTINGIPIKP